MYKEDVRPRLTENTSLTKYVEESARREGDRHISETQGQDAYLTACNTLAFLDNLIRAYAYD